MSDDGSNKSGSGSGEEEDVEVGVGFYEGDRDEASNTRHGFGSYYFPSGARYIGDWKLGQKHGVGSFVYPDGSQYEGQWYGNMKHGYGKYSYANGDSYNGQWSMDEKHGNGLYSNDMKRYYYQGYFTDGDIQGHSNVWLGDVRFSGTFEDGKPIGRGFYVLPNGLVVKGKYAWHGSKQTPVWTTKSVARSFP